ncbi:hypothetical protein HDU85_003574 [Gaertneriomyces sp. JEL0708]|nr:hypothetical protein HDU85_003574 [Gaertneriomyces sp. JEL0708]
MAKGRKKGIKPVVVVSGAKPVKVDTAVRGSETVVVDVDSAESSPSPVAVQEGKGNGDIQGGGSELGAEGVEQTLPVNLNVELKTREDVKCTRDGAAVEKGGRDVIERTVVDGAADDEASEKPLSLSATVQSEKETQPHITGQVNSTATTVPTPPTAATKPPAPVTKHIFAPSPPHSPHRPPPLATDPHPRTSTAFSPSRKSDYKSRPMSTPPPPSPPPLTPRPHLILTSTALGPISLRTPFHTLLPLLAPLGPTHLLYSPHRNTGFWIHLPAPRIGIFIHGTSHTVQRIECYDPSAVAIEYQGEAVCGDRVVPTFGALYRVLGPVYPGTLKPSTAHHACFTSSTTTMTTKSEGGEKETPVYVLRYPSLTLEFPVPEESGCDTTELPLRFRDGSSPVLSRLVVEDNQKPMGGEAEKENVWVTVVLGKGIYFGDEKGVAEKSVLLGDDLQSVVGVLGRPDGWVDKSQAQAQSLTGYGSEYIWNYFSLGIDLVVTAHHVRKIVLHTDVEGVVGWGIYQRCFFRVVSPPTIPTTTTTTPTTNTGLHPQPVLFTYTSTLASLLQPSKNQSTQSGLRVSEKPLTHNRGGMHPFGSTYFYGVSVCGSGGSAGSGASGGEDGGMVNRCVVEFTKEGFLVSLVMY